MNNELSSAVLLYLGYGYASFPKEDSSAVRARFGSDLLGRVEAMVREAGELEPEWEKHSLLSATDWAETEVRRRYASLNDAAVSALGRPFSHCGSDRLHSSRLFKTFAVRSAS